jgi:hypothetical protein
MPEDSTLPRGNGKGPSWYSRRVQRYEEMRWAQEPDRRRLPFDWGLDHVLSTNGSGQGHANGADPRAALDALVEEVIADSDHWFAASPAEDYELRNGVLTFTSQVVSPWAENNRVHAQIFPVEKSRAAVVVLAQWNARWEEQQNVCGWLNRLGITAVKMSLPYHDRRAVPGHPRADFLVSANLGLTLQANRQAVVDVRRTLRWLEMQGYDRLGVLGTSIGSCIGFVTMCHEPALRVGAFMHVSTYFGEVVARGLTTSNVWESLAPEVSVADLKRFWSPISPVPYLEKLRGSNSKALAISGRYDPTFASELTQQFFDAARATGMSLETLWLPCGHYSLGVFPFSKIAGYRFGTFLRRELLGKP